MKVLSHNWKLRLAALVGRARRNLLISSPYATREGTDLVAGNITATLRDSGHLSFVTDLSPANICQYSTDPAAILSLGESTRRATIRHLPRLHAKVYVADDEVAIVTSGNLTAGGLLHNHECGIEVTDTRLVRRIRRDISDLADLGALVTRDTLTAYCQAVDELRGAFERERRSAARAIKQHFEKTLRAVEDDLIRMRLAGGALHTVFARTIEYLLRRQGPSTTTSLHPLIAALHPDLCDDTVDRVIDGKRFGKKWKHAVRTAQQQLKKQGIVRLDGNVWQLT